MGPFEWSFVGAVAEDIVEDEMRVNKNDPFHNENEYEYDGFSIYDTSLDDVDNCVSKLEAVATLSLLEEQCAEDTEVNQPEEQEFVSLKEVNNLINKKRKLPLRPFEKYIQDLVAGKKTLDDGLD